ncbi:Lrrc48 [Acrasis kona]|uniref:Lrrc48 n=1 Tax=Acrasis kona TaxID=1008807 RepID=A0AAW2YIW9_9EUKA
MEPATKKRRMHDEITIDCSHQKLSNIEEYFKKNFKTPPDVTKLNVSNNYVTTLSPKDCDGNILFNTNNLIKINAGANNLTEIPLMTEFPNCVELCLNNNKIGSMSYSLSGNNTLERLDLRFNRIKIIENMNHLTQLKSLTLSSNQIESLDGLPDQMPQLQFLGLFCNKLSDFEHTLSILKKYPSITDLYIAGNPIYPVEISGGNKNHQKATEIIKLLPNLKWLNGERVNIIL